MLKYIWLLLIFLILVSKARAQDSTRQLSGCKRFPYRQQAASLALIAAGTATLWKGNETLIRYTPRTYITADDYLQYAPMLGMYVADIAGAKAQNSAWDQTKYLALSQLACAAVVQTLKYTVRAQRPNKGSRNSFPSGHTSVAFVGAAVMYHEFRHTHRLLAYSGFFVATAVGALRQTNRRHYISDVLAGAGIGMLVTNIVYHFEPLKTWQPFSKSDNLSLLPYYDGHSAGLSLAIRPPS
jgi:membrane-associated phospholipid phosphatase